MKKSEVWAKVLEIKKEHKINEKAFQALAEILEPKKSGGGSSRIIEVINGLEYRACRFTGQLWPLDELVYQNDEMKELKKDKGYSKIGISLWNKGQKYIKDLKNKLTDEIMKDVPDVIKIEEFKTELKEIEAKNLGNDHNWLIEKFATPKQLEEINEKSLPIK